MRIFFDEMNKELVELMTFGYIKTDVKIINKLAYTLYFP